MDFGFEQMKLSITGTHAPSATSLSYTSLTWGHYLAKGVDSTRYHTIYSNNNEYFVIRRATFEDRDALCKVCLETGDSGADATTMYEDKHILGDRWVMPYVEHEPQLAFVLVNPLTKHVIGYALGCIDTTKFEDFMEINYLPRMQIKYSKKEGLRSVHDTIYRDDNVTHDFHNFHRTPDSVCNHESYSSHLHIDIIPQYQGQGLGKPLLSYLLRQVRNHRETSTGIFLEMSGANSRARGFYKSLGFQQLLIVNESTKDIISSSTWKFNPSNTSTSHAVALDASVIIYMGMSLSSGEKGCVLTSSGTVWNPLRLVRYGHNMLASFIADTLSREGHEGTLRNILVCTAPEPWELLKDSVANALGATGDVSGRVTCYMVTSMDERLLLSDLNEWQKKHYTLVVGIGGGSACDYAKYMCDALDLPLVLVPSILSVDAPFTRAAGIRVVNGGRTSVRYVGDVADRLVGLLIDFSLLRGAPQQLNKAGILNAQQVLCVIVYYFCMCFVCVLCVFPSIVHRGWRCVVNRHWFVGLERSVSKTRGKVLRCAHLFDFATYLYIMIMVTRTTCRFSVDIARDALVVLNNLLNSSSELSRYEVAV